MALLRDGYPPEPHDLEKVFVFRGLERLEVPQAEVGDIVAVCGVDGVSIGDTIADGEHPEALPLIEIGRANREDDLWRQHVSLYGEGGDPLHV